jgi:queuosine precursor transporter
LFLACAVRFGAAALTAFVALSGVFANLFVVKQMELFGLQVTCSDVFAVGGIIGLNLLQEFFGKDAAQKAVRVALVSLLFFVAMAWIHLHYIPNQFDQTHQAYLQILGHTPRIVGVSIGVYYFVQRADVVFFAFLKRWIPYLGGRLIISLFVSQGLDTIMFSFFGLYGLVASVLDVMIVSFLVKCSIIACSSPFAILMKRYIWRDAA